MKFQRIVGGVSLAATLGLVSCSAEVNDGPSGPPPLSEEDQAIVANMNANILSEIETADAKILFIETSPGDVSVITTSAMDVEPPFVEDAQKLTLVELHRALAPEREVPQAIFDAQERYAEGRAAVAPVASSEIDAGAYAGDTLQREVGEEPVARTSRALASSIDKDWFVNRYCLGFSGASYVYCYTTAWQGAWARRHTHRHGVVLCADRGAARLRMKANGSSFLVYDVDYGDCTRWLRHGPHDFFGGSVGETIESTVDWAEDTVRYAGYFVDNDNLIIGPPGFIR